MPDLPLPPELPTPDISNDAGPALSILPEPISVPLPPAGEPAPDQPQLTPEERMAILHQMYMDGTKLQRQEILQQQLQNDEAMEAAEAALAPDNQVISDQDER